MRCSTGVLLGAMALLTSQRLSASEPEEALVYPVSKGTAYPVSEGTAAVASGPLQTEPDFTTRRFVLQARTGLATSVGFVGVLGELNVHDRLAVNAGVGSNFYGWSPAFGVRLRPIIFTSQIGTRSRAAYAITLEGSLSRSAFGQRPSMVAYCIEECPTPAPHLQTRYVSWGQIELGVEMRAAQRYQVTGSLGWAKMLGKPQFNCIRETTGEHFDCSHDTRITPRVFVITFAVGYAF